MTGAQVGIVQPTRQQWREERHCVSLKKEITLVLIDIKIKVGRLSKSYIPV
ncbi:MAG: hypothetical protein KA112_05090 [Alphaproteobacteria bacterium]|nr:hypothetical protein [Alphaproteobacteria bacterium]